MNEQRIKIGIPSALLFYEYKDLWLNFFNDIGVEVVTSGLTTYDMVEKGISIANDEACLSLKVFLGHVAYLIDKVDYILIPRIISLKNGELLCTNFSALYDIVNNIFRGVKFIDYNIDVANGITEKMAFLKLGSSLNISPVIVKKAYAKARRIQNRNNHYNFLEQIDKFKKVDNGKILMVGHSYNTRDPLIGGYITSILNKNKIDVIYADILDDKDKMKQSISLKNYWTFNIDLLKGIEYYQDKVDGILLLTTFPCGPDSLSNEMIVRKINKPIISIIMDELKSVSGIETRLESFIDIILERRMMNGSD